MAPALMGILNVTPDSFSDGGESFALADAVARGVRLVDEGADWVDVGGESTRPGAPPVDEDVEIARVVPVIRGLVAARPDARISIDTSKAAVAEAAIAAGATMVNDVTALGDPSMGALCARTGARVVLMHMRGTPRTMQEDTSYVDLVGEVSSFLAERARYAMAQGVDPSNLLVDPGVGFGKSSADNPRLIAAVPAFKALGYPVVVGASRKRFVGLLSGVKEPRERVFGSIGAALAAAARGADVLRVHDVAATRQALAVFLAVP